jgi:hypothetical protein
MIRKRAKDLATVERGIVRSIDDRISRSAVSVRASRPGRRWSGVAEELPQAGEEVRHAIGQAPLAGFAGRSLLDIAACLGPRSGFEEASDEIGLGEPGVAPEAGGLTDVRGCVLVVVELAAELLDEDGDARRGFRRPARCGRLRGGGDG